MDRRPNTQELQWFVDRNAGGELDLDPPFQRRSVWSLDYQRFFVDTVLRGLPSPPIFLEIEIEPGTPTKYNVLDGKQRLSAVFEFMNNEFHLAAYQAEEGFEDAYWEDLPRALQNQFVNYVFSVENITDTSEAELRDAFKRLNRNVARLTAQELRHAQFPGVFLDRMENLAAARFWTEKRIVGSSEVRRMRDIEFVSEIFLLTMHGVLDGKRDILDRYYASYTDSIPDESDHRAAYDENIDFLRSLDLDWSATRWKNMSDFYGLWGALLDLRKRGRLSSARVTTRRLTEFSDTQRAVLEASRERKPLPGQERDRRYFDAVRQGANKDSNRRERVQIISDVLRK